MTHGLLYVTEKKEQRKEADCHFTHSVAADSFCSRTAAVVVESLQIGKVRTVFRVMSTLLSRD